MAVLDALCNEILALKPAASVLLKYSDDLRANISNDDRAPVCVCMCVCIYVSMCVRMCVCMYGHAASVLLPG